MAGQLGSALIVQVGDGASPEVFTTVAGLRTKSMTLAKDTVDISDSDSLNKWRELLAGAAIKSASFSGDGVFKDSASEETVRANFTADSLNNYQVVVPDFGTFAGAFVVSQLEYNGEHDGAVQYSFSLESGGEVTFTAA